MKKTVSGDEIEENNENFLLRNFKYVEKENICCK